MPRIQIPQIDKPASRFDKVIGSDVDNASVTRNYQLGDILALFNSLSGGGIFSYRFTSALGDLDTVSGTMATVNGVTNPDSVTSFRFSTLDLDDGDVTSLAQNYEANSDNVVLKLTSESDSNLIAVYTITSVTATTNYVDIEVLQHKNFNSLTFINHKSFTLSFDYVNLFGAASGATNTSQLTNDGEDGINPFITAGDILTDHISLSNIGVNTHAQIDVHMANANVHFTQGSISITESQISDLQDYFKIDQTAPQTIINGTPIFSKGINTTSIQFDINATPLPSAVGLLQWNSDEQTLDLHSDGVTYQIGQEIAPLVKNQTGTTILNGSPVMFGGTVGASGRVLIIPAFGDGTLPSSYILGLTTEDILNGEDGHVTWFGKVRAIDTTGTPYGEVWIDGDLLYVSPTTAGELTNVPPEAPNPQIFMAVVVFAHATQGTLFARPSWRGKMTDLDDVNGTALTTDGQLVVWDNTSQFFDFTSNISDFALSAHDHVEADITDLQAYLLDITSESIGDLSDVTVGAPVARHVLVNNGGGGWTNRFLVEADISDLQAYLLTELNDLSSNVTWINVPDSNITESSVTQHEAALSIVWTQVTSTPTTIGGYGITDFVSLGDAEWMQIGQQLAITKGTVSGEYLRSYDSVTGLFTSNTVSYLDLDDIPSSFPPSAHTHILSEITDFDDALFVHIAGTETITGAKTFSSIIEGVGIQNATGDLVIIGGDDVFVVIDGTVTGSGGEFSIYENSLGSPKLFKFDQDSNLTIGAENQLSSLFFGTGGLGITRTASTLRIGDFGENDKILELYGFSGNAVLMLDDNFATLNTKLTSTGQLIAEGGLRGGINQTQFGTLALYGHATGSAQGGSIAIYPADDHDGTQRNYLIQAIEDDLRFDDWQSNPLLTYDGGNNKWNFSKDVSIGNNVLSLGAGITMVNALGLNILQIDAISGIQLYNNGTETISIDSSGFTIDTVGGGNSAVINTVLLTTLRNYEFPDVSGTLLVDSDLYTLGTDEQIPVMNSGEDDFEYFAGFVFDSALNALRIGTDDAGEGRLFLYGGASGGQPQGGGIFLFADADYDSPNNHYSILAWEDNLQFADQNDSSLMQYTGGTSSWDFFADTKIWGDFEITGVGLMSGTTNRTLILENTASVVNNSVLRNYNLQFNFDGDFTIYRRNSIYRKDGTFTTQLNWITPTAVREIYFPDEDGVLAIIGQGDLDDRYLLNTTDTLTGVLTITSNLDAGSIISDEYYSQSGNGWAEFGGATLSLGDWDGNGFQTELFSSAASVVLATLDDGISITGKIDISDSIVIGEGTDIYFEDFVTNLGDFTTSGDTVWARVTDDGVGDLFSAKAGTITHNESSTLQLIKSTTSTKGMLSFNYKVSSEEGWDYLTVKVDTVVEAAYSGFSGWRYAEIEITGSGSHTIEFIYSKDPSADKGLDTAWVDNVRINDVYDALILEGHSTFNGGISSEGDITTVNGIISGRRITLNGAIESKEAVHALITDYANPSFMKWANADGTKSFNLASGAVTEAAWFPLFNGTNDNTTVASLYFHAVSTNGLSNTVGYMVFEARRAAAQTADTEKLFQWTSGYNLEKMKLTAAGNLTTKGYISGTDFHVNGNIDFEEPSADSTAGEIIYGFGSTVTVAGDLYVKGSGGGWSSADADAASTATGLLAIAVGTHSGDDGMLLRGRAIFSTSQYTDLTTVGAPLYVSTTLRKFTETAPSGSGDIVRIIGYVLNITSPDEIYFCPDNTWVEII